MCTVFAFKLNSDCMPSRLLFCRFRIEIFTLFVKLGGVRNHFLYNADLPHNPLMNFDNFWRYLDWDRKSDKKMQYRQHSFSLNYSSPNSFWRHPKYWNRLFQDYRYCKFRVRISLSNRIFLIVALAFKEKNLLNNH